MRPNISREFDADSLARMEQLKALPRSARIHICGVCGTGMASVLTLLKSMGFQVTGSDKAFYPPMGDVVRREADKVYEQYSESNLVDAKPDFVIIGNTMSATNPEAEYVAAQNIPFASMPETLGALLVGDREHCPTSIVVAGTHGKTTTTSSIAYVLEKVGLKPGFFFGGLTPDLSTSIRAVDTSIPVAKRTVVLEGDEYDSAYFAKYSKFHCYRPDILIVTSLEFDHGDIYEDVEAIKLQFTRVIRNMPKGSYVIVCDSGGPELDKAFKEWSADSGVKAQLSRYGKNVESRFRLLTRTPDSSGQQVSYDLDGVKVSTTLTLTGEHNALNVLANLAVAKLIAVNVEEAAKAISTFHGALRRQQIIFNDRNIIVIEDFAHHPTAVRETLKGMRERYPNNRLIAVFEPRSNTSRQAFFQSQYVAAFAPADLIIIPEVQDKNVHKSLTGELKLLNVSQLVDDIRSSGKSATYCQTVPEIYELLLSELTAGDVAVLMSNGDFGGLPVNLVKALNAI